MKTKKTKGEIIAIAFFIIGIILLTYLISSIVLKRNSKDKCSKICNDLDALDSEVILNGKLDTHDLCTC